LLRRHIGAQKCKQIQVSSSQKQWHCVWLLDVEIEATDKGTNQIKEKKRDTVTGEAIALDF